jgi:hypothetical protein
MLYHQYQKHPKLSQNSRLAFMFAYYEYWRQFNDHQFAQRMRRILIMNRQFLDSFFNKDPKKGEEQQLLAYVNINDQKIELKVSLI